MRATGSSGSVGLVSDHSDYQASDSGSEANDDTSYVGIESVPFDPAPLPSLPSPSPRASASYAAVLAAMASPPRQRAEALFALISASPAGRTSPPATGTRLSPRPIPLASRTPTPPLCVPPVTKSYPPIVVECLPNWTEHFATLRLKLGHAPNARPLGQGVRFIPRSPEEYRVIQRHLVDAMKENPAISWYSYSVTAELPTKVAIRGLPADTPTGEIQSALQALDFPCTYVRQIKGAMGRQGCLFYAQLDRLPLEDLARLYRTTELLYMPGVRIEQWRGARLAGKVAQCHRCQAFGHSSANCHRPQKCVRCGGQHGAADCPRDRADKPTCANCGQGHTANDRRCPIYRREARRRGLKAPAPPPPPPTNMVVRGRAASPGKHEGECLLAPMCPPLVEGRGATLQVETNAPTERGAPVRRRKKRPRGGRKRKKPLASSTPQAPAHQPPVSTGPAPKGPPPPVEEVRLAPVPYQLPSAPRVSSLGTEQAPAQLQVPVGHPSAPLPQREQSARRQRPAALRDHLPAPIAIPALAAEPPSTANTDKDPIQVLLGILTQLLTAIIAGDDLRDAALRGLAFISQTHKQGAIDDEVESRRD